MGIGKGLAWTAGLLVLAGCANLGRDPHIAIDEKVYFDQNFEALSQTEKESYCRRIEVHLEEASKRILAVGTRGEYRPLKLTVDPGKCTRSIEVTQTGFAETDFPPALEDGEKDFQFFRRNIELADNHFDNHMLSAIFRPRDDQRAKHLFIFINGGLNDYPDNLNRSIRDYEHIDSFAPESSQDQDAWTRRLRPDERYHAVFLSWPSGFPDTYFDRTYHYDQGQYDTLLTRSTGWLNVFSDIAEGVVRLPQSYIKSLRRYYEAEGEILPTEQEPGIGDPRGACLRDSGLFADELQNFMCGNDISRTLRYGSTESYTFAAPARLISVPLVDPFGKRAWDSMLARARFTLRRPINFQSNIESLEKEKKDDLRLAYVERFKARTQGVFHRFFEKLRMEISAGMSNEELARTRAKINGITLVGHSMGAIVANEIVLNFQDLPFENIVFMAGAASIRDFRLMTEPVIRQRKKDEGNYALTPFKAYAERRPIDANAPDQITDLRFYNVTLHPISDETEINLEGVSPRGSLLEWIDDIFTLPPLVFDRTIGKWKNSVFARHDFDGEALTRMHFKRFGLSCASPRQHGEFRHRFPIIEEQKEYRALAFANSPAPPSTCDYISSDGQRKTARVWQYWDPRFWALDNAMPVPGAK